MIKGAALVGICGLVWLAASAHAADVTLKSRFAQTLSIDSNYQLQPHPPGETYAPVSTLSFDAVARTPTMKFMATVDLSYRTYFGPGVENLLPGLDRGFRVSAEKNAHDTTYKLTAARFYRQTASLQLAETGVNTIGGETINTFVDALITHQLSPWDQLSWVTRATTVEFVGSSTGTPSLDVTTTGAWRHRLTPLTNLTPTIQYERISYQSTANTQVEFWRGWLGFDSRLTKRLSARGSAGVIRSELRQSGPVNAPNPAQFAGGVASTWIGDILLSYQLTSRDTATLAAARSVSPDSFGQIRDIKIIGTVLTHRINHYSTLGFSAQASHQVSVTTTTDLYSSAVTYSRQLDRNWYTDISYRLRQRMGGNTTGPATSHAMFLSIKRDFTILAGGVDRAQAPVIEDPTALMAAPAEWAITRRFDLGLPY